LESKLWEEDSLKEKNAADKKNSDERPQEIFLLFIFIS